MSQRGFYNLLGLIGYPVSHSRSPVMQSAALSKKRIPAIYVPFSIEPSVINHFFKVLPSSNIIGVNVTVPYKEIAYSLCDSHTPIAQALKAVNTIRVVDGKLIGHNTDVEGFILAIKNKMRIDLNNKKVLLLGAGGSARAIAMGCFQSKVDTLWIKNRTPSRMMRLLRDMSKYKDKTRLKSVTELHNIYNDIDMIINATALGLKSDDPLPLPLCGLSKRIKIVDIVYQSAGTTKWVRNAKSSGHQAIDGLEMLLYQGAASFSFWFPNVAPPLSIMRKALYNN